MIVETLIHKWRRKQRRKNSSICWEYQVQLFTFKTHWPLLPFFRCPEAFTPTTLRIWTLSCPSHSCVALSKAKRGYRPSPSPTVFAYIKAVLGPLLKYWGVKKRETRKRVATTKDHNAEAFIFIVSAPRNE